MQDPNFITLTANVNGQMQQMVVKKGFSWTVLFFSGWALLFRGQLFPALICLLTFGFASFYYCFVANDMRIKALVAQGWSYAGMPAPQMQFRPI